MLKASKKLYGVKTPFKRRAADKVIEKVIADQEYLYDNFEEGAFSIKEKDYINEIQLKDNVIKEIKSEFKCCFS